MKPPQTATPPVDWNKLIPEGLVAHRPWHEILGWVVIGVVAGWLSGRLVRGGGFGLLANLFIGLIGAIIGGWIFGKAGIQFYGFLGNLAAATVGALALVLVVQLLTGPKAKN